MNKITSYFTPRLPASQVNAWNHLVAHPDIGVNGFKTAGIIKAIEDPAPLSMAIQDESDPFATNSETEEAVFDEPEEST